MTFIYSLFILKNNHIYTRRTDIEGTIDYISYNFVFLYKLLFTVSNISSSSVLNKYDLDILTYKYLNSSSISFKLTSLEGKTLDIKLKSSLFMNKKKTLKLMEGHILQEASLSGLFTPPVKK